MAAVSQFILTMPPTSVRYARDLGELSYESRAQRVPSRLDLAVAQGYSPLSET